MVPLRATKIQDKVFTDKYLNVIGGIEMKKDRILNPQLISEIAAIGHTQYFVIGDAGLPIPPGVKVIDLSLTKGIPSFMQVLKAVDEELVSEAYILAEEIKDKNAGLEKEIQEIMGDKPVTYVPHEEFKKLTKDAKVMIRTGETSSYANIIMIAGVNF